MSLYRDEVTPIVKPWRCPRKDPTCARVDPCPSCRTKEAHRRQSAARKRLGVPNNKFRSRDGNEENWRDPVFRHEVKSGKQVESLCARFLDAEKQSENARPIGDTRAFAFVAMPDGMGSEGIVAVRLSTWAQTVKPALDEYWCGS